MRYGSKPVREIEKDPALPARLTKALRPWEEVVGYPPNQAFIGNLVPDDLVSIPRPWYGNRLARPSPPDRSDA